MPGISLIPSGPAQGWHQHFPKQSSPWKTHWSAEHSALANQCKSTTLPAGPSGLHDASITLISLASKTPVHRGAEWPKVYRPTLHPILWRYTHPTHLWLPVGRGQKRLSLTGHREISSHLYGASRSQSSCCCSSSALSGRGSLTRSGCTLQGDRCQCRQELPLSHPPALSKVQLVSTERGNDCLSVGHLAHELVHAST